MIKYFKLLLLLSIALFAQSATTRPVTVSWVASPTTGVTGYQVYRAIAGTSTFVALATPTGPGATSYSDPTAPIGQTVQYGVVAITPPCTATTPVTTVCGNSPMAVSAATPIPVSPSSIIITITTQVI